MKPEVVFVLGGPGAGKGTQCHFIVEKFGYVHLSAGELLRKECENPNSLYSNLISEHIKNGTIVPVEITCRLLKNAMDQSERKHFLIDGFPRNENNLQGWKKEMGDEVVIKFILFFECSDEVCIDRCLKRGKFSNRTDDNKESLLKRIQTYRNSTLPIIEYYEARNMVRRINADRSVSEIWDDVKNLDF